MILECLNCSSLNLNSMLVLLFYRKTSCMMIYSIWDRKIWIYFNYLQWGFISFSIYDSVPYNIELLISKIRNINETILNLSVTEFSIKMWDSFHLWEARNSLSSRVNGLQSSTKVSKSQPLPFYYSWNKSLAFILISQTIILLWY